jgi:Domain of unknown function (DUF5753)
VGLAADILPTGAAEYLGLEAAATQISMYAVGTMPGLLQTEEYATAACRASRPDLNHGQISQLVAIQNRRHETLLSGDHVLDLIIDESALRQVIGSADTLTRQLVHLAQIMASASVTVRITELNTTPNTISPPFMLLILAGPDAHAVAWINGIRGQVTVSARVKDVRQATETFSALSATALSGDESACLIRRLAGNHACLELGYDGRLATP